MQAESAQSCISGAARVLACRSSTLCSIDSAHAPAAGRGVSARAREGWGRGAGYAVAPASTVRALACRSSASHGINGVRGCCCATRRLNAYATGMGEGCRPRCPQPCVLVCYSSTSCSIDSTRAPCCVQRCVNSGGGGAHSRQQARRMRLHAAVAPRAASTERGVGTARRRVSCTRRRLADATASAKCARLPQQRLAQQRLRLRSVMRTEARHQCGGGVGEGCRAGKRVVTAA